MKTLVIVQARTGSSRLPGKVLLPVGHGSSMLEHQLARVRAAREPFQVCVATTVDPADAAIFEVCRRAGVPCRAGHPTDLLDRHFQIARAERADIVVKVPSDCPLIDPAIIDRVIRRFREAPLPVDYVSNLHPATYPDGNDVEVISMEALATAYEGARRSFEREHTTPFIWEQPERFRIGNVLWETGLDYSMRHRWTVDYPEDYQLVRAVFDRLWTPMRPIFSLAEILRLFEDEPQLVLINARYRGVNWYRHHLDELTQVKASETRCEALSSAKTM